ncbi:MAG: glycosyltransferase family 2 protein [Janthinobacterium lividum]
MTRPLVLIPSYNPGPHLARTLRDALAQGHPVWVVSDGSTDGSDAVVEPLGARLLRLPRNRGKGAAVQHGLREAAAEHYTHALVMDADGQHPAACIRPFIAASAAHPAAMVLGRPVFGPEAPRLRMAGHRLSNLATRHLAGAPGIADSLFGFRVYPIAPLLAVMAATRHMRGFDFDPEAAIRLARAGVPALNLPAPVLYRSRRQGGVSHFRYARDNLRLAWMYARLALAPRPSSAARP